MPKSSELVVCEIFGPTIQGEGKFAGTPSVFIRFAKCNFSCTGFAVSYETPVGVKKYGCDTYYAVDKEFKNSWKKYEDYSGIVNEVDNLVSSYNYKIDIVITGGEPLLYWKNEEFQKLLKHYIDNGYRVTIETNASLDINFNQEFQKKLIFSMSVKLSNSKEPLKKRVNKLTLAKILENTKESYLKFVIVKDFIKQAKDEIEDILKDIAKCEVYLMPQGDTNDEINKNAEVVINMAIENGFKYTDRLHIRIWNNKRAV